MNFGIDRQKHLRTNNAVCLKKYGGNYLPDFIYIPVYQVGF